MTDNALITAYIKGDVKKLISMQSNITNEQIKEIADRYKKNVSAVKYHIKKIKKEMM